MNHSSYTYHWWLFNHVNVQGLVIDINSSVILLNFIFNQGLFFCVPYQILSGITQRESKLFLETKNQTYYILRKKYWKKKKCSTQYWFEGHVDVDMVRLKSISLEGKRLAFSCQDQLGTYLHATVQGQVLSKVSCSNETLRKQTKSSSTIMIMNSIMTK